VGAAARGQGEGLSAQGDRSRRAQLLTTPRLVVMLQGVLLPAGGTSSQQQQQQQHTRTCTTSRRRYSTSGASVLAASSDSLRTSTLLAMALMLSVWMMLMVLCVGCSADRRSAQSEPRLRVSAALERGAHTRPGWCLRC
jgi:ABC-type Na+ efflux pump permease subunit